MAQTHPDVDLDDAGNVILKPLTGYAVTTIASVSVFLRAVYADRPEDLGGPQKAVQLAIQPYEALALAADLQRAAKRALAAPTDGSA